jgi:hypothetical protein
MQVTLETVEIILSTTKQADNGKRSDGDLDSQHKGTREASGEFSAVSCVTSDFRLSFYFPVPTPAHAL